MLKIVYLPIRHLLAGLIFLPVLWATPVFSQQDEPVIVRPGSPGQPTKQLPSSTRATLPELSAKDVEFMQGMIMHHAQAVEMTALIKGRTDNREIRLLGARISQSQSDEMEFMARWLKIRGEALTMSSRSGSHSHGNASSDDHSMPGMLSVGQMEDLRLAKGSTFDKLFLMGMIQHHEGALIMVKDLFDTAGAGQDAELFNFASDVDSGQRAEINIMKTLLGEKP
ncbi:MAG: DUF305 domain-containing protein [Acidobacteria bacterium]|nr:DUF305 domain-containing protein [Acidobacteriota bacterium]